MNITCNLIAFLLLVPGPSSRLAERVVGEHSTLSEQTPVSEHMPPQESGVLAEPASNSGSASGGRSARSASKSKKGSKAAALAARLSIARRGLRPQPERVAQFKELKEEIVFRTAVPGPFADYPDFAKRALHRVSTEVRDYAVVGHGHTSVVFSEDYAALLESINKSESIGSKSSHSATNLSQESSKTKANDSSNERLARRVRPEDIPQLLDAMPDSRLFKRVLVSENANPEDDYVTQIYYPEGFISSMAMIDGQLELYKAERNEFLCRDVLHEWSHQLRYEFWNDRLMKAFEDAVSLEKVEWNPSIYATRSNGEQWAVLGERMLGSSGEEFLTSCKNAPIRTAIWMRALQKCLADVSEDGRSIDHDKYVERVRFVESKILPKALRKLGQMRRDGETAELRDQAAAVLDYLRENDWKKLARNVALIFCLERYTADAEEWNAYKEA
jgi:hypothetical protein